MIVVFFLRKPNFLFRPDDIIRMTFSVNCIVSIRIFQLHSCLLQKTTSIPQTRLKESTQNLKNSSKTRFPNFFNSNTFSFFLAHYMVKILSEEDIVGRYGCYTKYLTILLSGFNNGKVIKAI